MKEPEVGKQPQADDNETLNEDFANARFGTEPAVGKVEIVDISTEPADKIERFKEIWTTKGKPQLENYVHEYLRMMRSTGGPDTMDRFADRFWNYVWNQIGGHVTNDPTVQMMVGLAATVVLQQKRIKEEVEEEKKFVASFEEEARKYVKEALQRSQAHVIGELVHYFGGSWISHYLGIEDDGRADTGKAARRGLGIAAAGLARRRNALINANETFRNMVHGWGHYALRSEVDAFEVAHAEVIHAYEVFRLQVILRFPILDEISSSEIDPYDEDAKPDDREGEQLNMLAKMAQSDDSEDAVDLIVNTVREKLRNIWEMEEENEAGGDINIWVVPRVVQATRQRIGVAHGSLEDEAIEEKLAEEKRPRNESESLLGKILWYGGLVLAPFTDLVSMIPSAGYEAYKVGSEIKEDIKKYRIAKALHGTDFGAAALSAEDPSLFWLAGDIVKAGLVVIDLAPLAGPAVRIFRRLTPLARLAREVKAGEEALIALRSSAQRAAAEELKLGLDGATEFAENVAAHARAARTGETVGVTAEEARMLEEAEPEAAKAAAKQLDPVAAEPAPMTKGEPAGAPQQVDDATAQLQRPLEMREVHGAPKTAGGTKAAAKEAELIESEVADLQTRLRARGIRLGLDTLAPKYRILKDLGLDAAAVERVLAKKSVDQMKGQILEELQAVGVQNWLTDDASRAALAGKRADEPLEFIAGHRITDQGGAQLTDGVLAVNKKDRYEIITVFETKAGRPSARGLGKSRMTLKELRGSEAAYEEARNEAVGEVRERFRNETKGLTNEQIETTFKAEVEAIIERELPREEAGQMLKTIERLSPNAGEGLSRKGSTPILIDGKPANVTAGRQSTRVIGVTPFDVSHASIIRAASDQGVNIGMMRMPITQKELERLAEDLAKLLNW